MCLAEYRGAEAAPPQTTDLQRCAPQLSPPLAGCPHPSRCGAAPHRATFPKGKAKRSAAAVRTDLILCAAPHSTLFLIPNSALKKPMLILSTGFLFILIFLRAVKGKAH